MVRIDEFLGSIGVEDQMVKQIMAILESNAEMLNGGQPSQVPRAAFGGSTPGTELGKHTSLAHQHVVEAMTELAAGMEGYRINVDRWHCDHVFTDEDSGAMLNAIEVTNGCTDGPDFTTATQTATTCDAPTVAATGGDS